MNLPVTTGRTSAISVVKAEEGQYLTFTLDGNMHAIGIQHIKEILEYGGITAVPMMPGFIRGVINLRGAVVPIVDLSARFGDRQSEVTKRSCIVIVEVFSGGSPQDIGVVVDTVSEVLKIRREDIEEAPAFGAQIRTDFIAGMGKTDGGFVIILNADTVLSVDELAMVSDADKWLQD